MPEVAAAQQAQEAKAAFDKRMLNKRPLDEPTSLAGGAGAPAADAAASPPPKAKGPPVKDPPGQPTFQPPPPPMWQGSSGDATVPVKAKPCAYSDYRYASRPPADAAFQPGAVAQEHAALLAAAHRRADAAGPARDKPYGAQELNYAFREPPNPWRLDRSEPAAAAMVGKGKGKAGQPTPFGDPWSGMVARNSKGVDKGDAKGKGKEAKSEKRPVAGCQRCGGFFICQKAAEGKGLGIAHCTNAKCERSLEYARLGVEDKKIFLAANLAARESEAAAARLEATRAEARALDAGIFARPPAAGAAAAPGAAAHGVIDVDAYSPLTPPGAAAAAAQSDTDVSSPAGEPVGQAAQAPGPAPRKPPTKAPSHAQMAAMVSPPANQFTEGYPPAARAALAMLWEPQEPPATSAQLMTWAAAEIATSRAAAHEEALAAAHDALAAANDKIRELERKAVADAHHAAAISWNQQQRIAELHQDLAAEGGNEQQRTITQLEEAAEGFRERMMQLSAAMNTAVDAMNAASALANTMRDF